MRKIKLQMQLSVDGFAGGPNGEQDWMTWNWDDALKNYVTNLTATCDTMLLGRVLYQGMSGYWPAAAADESNPDNAFAHTMNNMPKLVFSTTLQQVEWTNAQLATRSLTDEVARLKAVEGKDIIVYGGARFVSSLIAQNLIDEYHLFINPVVLGKGLSIFVGVEQRAGLKLVNTTVSTCGIVVLCYVPAF